MPENRRQISNGARPSLMQQSPAFLECLAKWMHVFNRVYRQPMEPGTIWAYRETLSDLTVEEIDRGCVAAMKATRFTPTPAEIREYGILPSSEAPALNALPAGPPITDEEAKQFFEELKANVPCLSEESKRKDGIIEITDEMRARHEAKNREALERFGKAS